MFQKYSSAWFFLISSRRHLETIVKVLISCLVLFLLWLKEYSWYLRYLNTTAKRHLCLLQCWGSVLKCQVLPKQPCLIMILFSILWISFYDTHTQTHTFFSTEMRLHSKNRLVTWMSGVTLYRLPGRRGEIFVKHQIMGETVCSTDLVWGDQSCRKITIVVDFFMYNVYTIDIFLNSRQWIVHEM